MKVIIDTDCGFDDIVAILYLIRRSDIEIVGITVTGCGETHLQNGVRIAQLMLSLGMQKGVKVYIGADKPLQYNHHFPDIFRKNMDDVMGLIDTIKPEIDIKVGDIPAWQFIYETIKSQDVSILSIGGFTNIAKMLDLYPDNDYNTKIIAMGGSLYRDGNIARVNNAKPEYHQGTMYSSNHTAEWNIFLDPVAAQKVIETHIPLTFTTLNLSDHLILNDDYLNVIDRSDQISNFVYNVIECRLRQFSEHIPISVFDLAASIFLVDGIKDYQLEYHYITIDTTNTATNNTSGEISIVPTGTRKIGFVVGMNSKEFIANFAEVINSKKSSGKFI